MEVKQAYCVTQVEFAIFKSKQFFLTCEDFQNVQFTIHSHVRYFLMAGSLIRNKKIYVADVFFENIPDTLIENDYS